ncbi:MAG TPA: hypothetical protein DEF51_48085 [Myxococcales bacterium]|nr:hypothetical protein [Myxococcales bacterium]
MHEDPRETHREGAPIDADDAASQEFKAMLRSDFEDAIERLRRSSRYTKLSPTEFLLLMFATKRLCPEAVSAFEAERLGVIDAAMLARHSLEEQVLLLEGYDRDASRALGGQ